MWNKIKKVFIILGTAVCSFCFALLFKSCSDRRRSTGNDERDRKLQESIDKAEGNISEADRIAGELSENITGRAEECEGHLSRAEEILREAIKRGEEEKNSSLDNSRN